MRRSGLIAPAAVLAAAVLAPQAQAATGFRDVDQSTPHQADIVWLAGTGITTGWKDGTFRGMESVKRQDMAAFLYRLAGSPTVSGSEGFRDVDASTPHYREIVWLASTGITTGWRDGTFRGMESVRRQDMAAFLHRFALKYPGRVNVREHGGVVFRDVDSTTPHAQDVWWLSSTRVATGWPDGTFRGLNPVVRQDMAAFLHRIANPSNTYGDTDNGKPGNNTGNTSKPNNNNNGGSTKPGNNNTSKPNNGDNGNTGNQNNTKPDDSAALAEARRQLAQAQAAQSQAAGALQSADQRVTAARGAKAKADGAATAAAQAKAQADGRVKTAQAASDKADRDVRTAQAAYDRAEAKAKAAREQIAKGSLGFYQTMGWQQAVDVLTNKGEDPWDIQGQPWFKLGDPNSATSLENMRESVKFMRETNQLRAQEGAGPLKVAPREEALAQAQADYDAWGQGGHYYYDWSQNIAAGYNDPLDGWYRAEKKTWEAAVAKDPSMLKYKYDLNGLYNDRYEFSQQVGHYLNIIQTKWTVFGEAHNSEYGTDAQNFSEDKFNTATGPLVSLDSVSVDEYASKLDAYVDSLNAQVKPADDAKAALDKAKTAQQSAQTELNNAKTSQQNAAQQVASTQAAQASAQKELDAAVKAQASAATAKAQADKAVADAQRKVDSLSK